MMLKLLLGIIIFASIGLCSANRCLSSGGLVSAPKRRCSLSNDPHLVSWDGARVDNHIECPLIMAKPCDENSKKELENEGVPYFEIISRSDRREHCKDDGNDNWCPANVKSVAFLIKTGYFQVNFEMNNQKELFVFGSPVPVTNFPAVFPVFIFGIGEWIITVDEDESHPWYLNLNAAFAKPDFTLELDIAISRWRIELDMNGRFAQTAQQKLCGACGQHNYDTCDNDFTWSNGTVFSALEDSSPFDYVSQSFYENDPAGSYTVIDAPASHNQSMKCDRDPRMVWGDTGSDPNGRKKRQLQGRTENFQEPVGVCKYMTQKDGPFASCQNDTAFRHALITCNFDVSVNASYGCATLEAAAEQCRAQTKRPIGNWRKLAKCEVECSNGRVYSTEINRECPQTCFKPKNVSRCSRVGIEEGCVCPEKQVWNGDKCVPRSPHCQTALEEAIKLLQKNPRKQCDGPNDYKCLIKYRRTPFCKSLVGSAMVECLGYVYNAAYYCNSFITEAPTPKPKPRPPPPGIPEVPV